MSLVSCGRAGYVRYASGSARFLRRRKQQHSRNTRAIAMAPPIAPTSPPIMAGLCISVGLGADVVTDDATGTALPCAVVGDSDTSGLELASKLETDADDV